MGTRTAYAWGSLPDEIVQVLGLYLDAQGWSNARLTCKAWSRNITADIKLLEIDLERSAHRWMMVLTCVARLFPQLNCIVLLVGNRITPAVFAERMAALAITSIKLQELELRFVYVSQPTLGTWLDDLSGVSELRHLRVLRLVGGATPPATLFQQLSSLRHLSVLDFLPGVYGQMFNDLDVDMASANGEGVTGGDGGLSDSHLAAIAQLTQLKHLTVKVCPGEVTPSGLISLASAGLLSQLESLSLYDSELPAACLAGWLRGAGKLTALQLGLSNVDDLAPLAKLPKLQNLSLDAAFLPDLRELVYSAARGNIPATGPGALTGLCLLDQALSSPLQLASLSQLSSLKELVIVNPLQEPSDLDEDAEQPAAAAAAAAADSDSRQQQGQQQQQQQGQPAVIDISALSGLRSLKLLQIDLKRNQQQQQIADPNQILIAEPLELKISAAGVQQLAVVWTNLVTIDLSGFGPDLLHEAAVAGFSSFKALRHLSIMTLDVSGGPGDGAGAQQGLAAGVQNPRPAGGSGLRTRKLAWWQLPKGLASLCLSHFDLTGPGSSTGGSSGGGRGRSSIPAGPCCSSCCCMAQPAVKGNEQQQQKQKQQHSPPPLGISSKVQQFINPCSSPLRSLGRRKQQQQQQHQDSGAVPRGGVSDPGASSSNSSEGSGGAAATAGAAAAGATADAASSATACLCATRVAAHFSSLQALWLEHCSLPPNFVPLALPAAAQNLESLALLHCSGTQATQLAGVAQLTLLTSLRLIPADHELEGLGALTRLRHLKKLSVRLAHLAPSDLSVLRQLRSLFCLSVAAPAAADGGTVRAGHNSPVRLQQVIDVVRDHLPYCDVEVQPEQGA